MSAFDTIKSRHSVREYTNQPISDDIWEALQALVEKTNKESGLNIQLIDNNPEVFNVVVSFSLIRGATNSIAFVSKGKEEDERIGYWGQYLVLRIQEMGLNTCWVALCSHKKSKAVIKEGEKLRLVISVGYGVTPGHERSTKTLETLCSCECSEMPTWFLRGMEAAQLAPTAMNNQHFHITLRADGKSVLAEATAHGPWDTVDLGIVKRNFEEAARELNSDWVWE